MNERIIELERNKIGSIATNLYGNCFRTLLYVDHEEESQNLAKAEKNLNILIEKYNSLDVSNRISIMGGEFANNYIGTADNPFPLESIGDLGLPLFMFLEIAQKALEENFIYFYNVSPENKAKAQELITKISDFKSKLSVLPHNKLFDSSKTLSKEAWHGISASKGHFSFKKSKDEEIEYVGITYSITHEDGVWKNGDYYSNGSSRYNGETPFYEEDALSISQIKYKKTLDIAEKYYKEFSKYFIDGLIPNLHEVEEKLIDKNLDFRLVERLKTFIIMYSSKGLSDDIQFALSDTGKYQLEQLHSIEYEILEEQKEAAKKETAITEARARYQQKSFFWKFLNRKLNPEKIRIEDMATEEIEELYTARRK